MNPKIIIIAVVLLSAVGLLTYVGLRPTTPPDFSANLPVQEDPLGFKTIEDRGDYHEAFADYPSKTSLQGSANAVAVATMKAWEEKTIAEFKTNAGIDSITAEDIAMQRLGERKYLLDIEYNLHESPTTVSYVYLVFEDTLGAHPNAYYKTFTFDRATGKELAIADLFTAGTTYLNTLSTKSREILVPQIAKASDIKDAEVDRSMLNPGTTPVVENFQWFYLKGTDLVLIFPPYSVGPWALGTQTVTIPRADLVTFLKAEYQ